MSDTAITELLTRARAHLDDYSQFLRRLPDDDKGRAKIGPLALTSALCVEVLADLREHTPEPAANVRVEDDAEVPPMTYTVLLPGRRLDPVDCWAMPGVGDTLPGGRVIVRRRLWVSGHEAELVCVYRPGGSPIDADL
jgi:hypothetical protein